MDYYTKEEVEAKLAVERALFLSLLNGQIEMMSLSASAGGSIEQDIKDIKRLNEIMIELAAILRVLERPIVKYDSEVQKMLDEVSIESQYLKDEIIIEDIFKLDDEGNLINPNIPEGV